MIHPFQPNISHNWHEHTNGLEHVRQALLAACGGHCRTQQVVESENVHYIEILQPRPAVTLDRRVPTHPSVTQPCRQIDCLYAILIPPPAKRRPFCRNLFLLGLQPFFQSPVGCKNGNLVASPCQPFRKCAHFHRGAAEFEERGVRFRDVQDSHCSRRIFFSDFAKILKRNWCSASCLPRTPISFACAGSASNVSMLVASWI